MVRQTSVEVYRRIRDEGLLSELRFMVYDVIWHHGPLTQMEAWMHFNQQKVQLRSVTPRFSELEERDVICAVGERPCSITGNMATIWEVTDRLPIPIKKEKRPTYKELEKKILELQRANICPECKQMGLFK